MGILGLGVRGWNWRIGVGAWYSVTACPDDTSGQASHLLAGSNEAISSIIIIQNLSFIVYTNREDIKPKLQRVKYNNLVKYHYAE